MNIRDSGISQTNVRKGTECSSGLMAPYMKDILAIILLVVQGDCYTQAAMFMRESGKMIKHMGMANTPAGMDQFTKATERTICKMDSGKKCGLMVQSIWVNMQADLRMG